MAFPLPVEEEVALTGDPSLDAAEHSPAPGRRRRRRRRLPWFSGGILAWTGLLLPLVHAFVRGPAGMLGAVPRPDEWGAL